MEKQAVGYFLFYGYLAILVIQESLIPVHKNPIMSVENQLCLEGIWFLISDKLLVLFIEERKSPEDSPGT